MKRRKNVREKGITLVALVVTIIVLLILAGITLVLALGNNGVMDRAQYASNTWSNATKDEEAMMGGITSDIDRLSKMGDGGIDSANDGIAGEKVAVENLKAGDHISIMLNGVADPVDCVVLWDSNSSHASNGVQVITADTIGSDFYLGKKDAKLPATAAGYDFNNADSNFADFEKARWSYNNAVDNLNELARGYINSSYVTSARCVGSNPDNPNDFVGNFDKTNYSFLDSYGTFKDTDYNVLDNSGNLVNDVAQMDYLKIIATGGTQSEPVYKGFWLASRSASIFDKWPPSSNSKTCELAMGIIDGVYTDFMIASVESDNGASAFRFCEAFGFRPVFTLKSGIQVSRTSEAGTNGPGGIAEPEPLGPLEPLDPSNITIQL